MTLFHLFFLRLQQPLTNAVTEVLRLTQSEVALPWVCGQSFPLELLKEPPQVEQVSLPG